LDAVLRQFGLTLSYEGEWSHLKGPTLDRWLRRRTGDQLAATFVLLVETPARDGAHWLPSARGVLCDSFTQEWTADFPGGEGPDGGWRRGRSGGSVLSGHARLRR
jgi:hypothetical protein